MATSIKLSKPAVFHLDQPPAFELGKPPSFDLGKPPLLTASDPELTRANIANYFSATWELYESLFALIRSDRGYYLRPEPLRHPLIFYYGHTATFYINKLILGKYLTDRVDARLESICAVGVDEMSWDDLKPDNYQWPTVAQVKNYRKQVKAVVLELIQSMPISTPIQPDSLAWVMLMGIEHERIHIETSSVIMRMMPLEYLYSSEQWPMCQHTGVAPANTLLAVSGKTVRLGKPASNDTYGWDNEYGEEIAVVADFNASQYLVSNAEFMQFIEAGGYRDQQWWTQEGQQWLAYSKAEMPRFWSYRDGQYWQRNLLDQQPLPLDWPVEVNYLEAKAFCNWLAATQGRFIRLPTEAEWQVMRDTLATDLPQWQQAPGNVNLEHYASSCPVNLFQQGEFYDIIGNVWQWTESPIDGYDGFAVHPLYDDFSTPTFDGLHNLIKGGSWISTGNAASRDSRYAFRRHFFQHAGFRYIESRSNTVPGKPVNPFEMQPDISQMLHRHYARDAAKNSGFAALANILQTIVTSTGWQPAKALDLGCGAGGLSYELARFIPRVEGVDFTARHIQHALHFQERGVLRYALPEEGELRSFHEVSLTATGLDELVARVDFAQGDGHNLKPQYTAYDVIVAHQVIEYLYDPALCIRELTARLNGGGLLLLSSAYQWHQQHTASSHWLGGLKRDGESVSTLDGLKVLLAGEFELVSTHDVASQHRLNARCAQVFDNQVSVWRKRAV